MIRSQVSLRPSRLLRRRGLLVVLVLLLGIAIGAGPRLLAWYHLRRGQAELQQYHAEEAQRHLDACLKLWPRNVTAHLLAARAARRLDDYEQAEEHLRQAQREQHEPSEELLFEWALHRASLGDLDRTESYLLPITREDSERAFLACEALTEGYRRTYRIPQALLVLGVWLERQPDNVRALLLRAYLWGQVNVYRQAIPDYQRVLEQQPQREDVRRWLAVCLMESSDWEEALSYLEDQYRRHPQDVETRVYLARCWRQLGEDQKAREMLQAVLVERPDHPLALRTLGEAFLQESQPAEAETWLRRAVAASPNDFRSQWFLYQALGKQQKTTEAEEQLDKTQKLGLRWKRFETITQHELSARPHDAELQAELGTLLLDFGYTEAGRNWLLSALKHDPQCRSAREALERLSKQSNTGQPVLALPGAIASPAAPHNR
jgi:tetratricopeptide (TPR) repeat protein